MAGGLTRLCRTWATGIAPAPRAPPSGRRSSCRTSTESLATSRPGWGAPITASVTITSKPTWTSSPFGSTAGAPRWPRSRPCWGSPRASMAPRPTTCCTVRSQPDRQNLGNSSPTLESNLVQSFREGLRRLGYVEGQNLVIKYVWAEGQQERYAVLARELVSLKPDVILAAGT